MKVLEQGRAQRGWSVEARCTGHGNGGGGCGALLLVERHDVYRTARHSYDGSSEYFATFMCRACSVETDFADDARPPFQVLVERKRERGK